MPENQGQNGQDLNQPPTEKILAMRNQKLSNNEIIQSLQSEGYNSNVILDGMNQADLKTRVEDGSASTTDDPNKIGNQMQFGQQSQSSSFNPPQNEQSQFDSGDASGSADQLSMAPPGNSGNYPQQDTNSFSGDNFSQGGMPPPMDDSQGAAPSYQGADQVTIERIEEIAEAIIDEKWNEIVKSINKIIDWKERTEGNINKLEQKFEDLRREFDNLNKGVLGKIGEYDKNLGNLGVEIKAMERVFQKIIPTMTENVHALQKLTDKLTDKAEKE